MAKIVECIPNFSEGRNQAVIDGLAATAKSIPGVTLLDYSSDASHNRSVFTLVGDEESIQEVAFQLVKYASENIDMTKHEGEHPRMGATDVCPFVPVKDITTAECVEIANKVAERINRELGIPIFLYEDAATEDYLQCLLLSIAPNQFINTHKNPVPQIRILKSPSPDALMLSNQCLLISTGLLTTLDTEEELCAILAREVAHNVLDHAIITTNKNITHAKRAEFWGDVANGVVAATEEYLYQRYYNYEPGLVFATNDLIQTLINEKIINRMGLDYSEKQEVEADEYAMKFMEFTGKNKEALISALTKIYSYYKDEHNAKALSKGDIYGTLEKRLEKMGAFTPLSEDRNYLKMTSTVVSFESGMMDYNRKYIASARLAMKNIDNKMACPNDYIVITNSIMKLSNTPENNKKCIAYLNKAEELSNTPNLNIHKLKILLSLRENKQTVTIKLLQEYQDLLENVIQQSHETEETRWLVTEQIWAEKLIHRITL